MQGRYTQVFEGRATTAHIAFIDEIFFPDYEVAFGDLMRELLLSRRPLSVSA